MTSIVTSMTNTIGNFKKIQIPLFFIGTFFSGFASLVYQVVWQRYLAILIGSEAKSSAIVVSIFLIGLALGYFVFGKIMEKDWSRYYSMKFYGYVELLTALYALAFPLLFQNFKAISFAGPNLFAFDIFIVVLCLIFPTFLMGGSIPILTTVLPNSPDQVNTTHAKIYGWNTLGACLGVFLSGFFLIPSFGLPYTMLIAGAINLAIAFIFLNNRLEGQAHKSEAVERIENTLSTNMLYFLVFVVGSITISLEVILMRLVGLSIGSSNMVFPIVLTIFIFGLGLGSLKLPYLKNSDGMYRRILAVSALWILVFLTVPYWGSWAAHIRVSLTLIPTNYYIFHLLLLFMFLILFFVPVFFLGQILPIAYSLLDKSGEDYGKKCGFLYASNTIGTAVGGLFFGYLLLYFMNLEAVFKLNIILLATTCAIYAFYEKKKPFGFIAIALLVFILFPKWNRTDHVMGLFRTVSVTPDMFKGFFHITQDDDREILYFNDGPNATVSIFANKEYLKNELIQKTLKELDLKTSVAVIMNGKSDGETLGDFSTMYFAGAIPYFFAPKATDLDVAVVGYGTGLTTGTLAQSKEVKKIDSLEMSYELLQARHLTAGANYDADSHPKVNHIHTDAFRHFTRYKDKYDLIITEPSNPWVTGVENLFTSDFLELTTSKLNEGGILAMWFQRYDSNNQVVKAILEGVVTNFNHYEVYEIGTGDSLILMSNSPLNLTHYNERANEAFHQQILNVLKIKNITDLTLMRSLNEKMTKVISLTNQLGSHRLEFPKLSDISNKLRFLSQFANMDSISDIEFDILLNDLEENKIAFKGVLERFQDFGKCETEIPGISSFCTRARSLLSELANYRSKEKDIMKRANSYTILRRFGLIKANNDFALSALSDFIQNKKITTNEELFKSLVQIMLLDNIDNQKLITELNKIESIYGAEKFKETQDMVKQALLNKKNALAIVEKL